MNIFTFDSMLAVNHFWVTVEMKSLQYQNTKIAHSIPKSLNSSNTNETAENEQINNAP